MTSLMDLMQNDPNILMKQIKNPNVVLPEPESVKIPSLQIKRKRPSINQLIGEENNPMRGDDAEILRQFFKLSRSQ